VRHRRQEGGCSRYARYEPRYGWYGRHDVSRPRDTPSTYSYAPLSSNEGGA